MKTQSLLTVFLSCATLLSNAQSSLSVSQDFQSFSGSSYPASTSLQSFTHKQDVVGSQYLFKDWVKGSVTNKAGITFTNGYFNFDKINQSLYLQLKDTSAAFLIDKNQLKSVSLSDGNTSYLLEKVPVLDSSNLYNALVKGSKYSLYSFTKTSFIPSNYQTNGIVTTGKLYDEFKDEVTYYVIFPDGSPHQIALKKKAIKSLFQTDKGKVDKFFKVYSDSQLDENLLKSLVEELNQ